MEIGKISYLLYRMANRDGLLYGLGILLFLAIAYILYTNLYGPVSTKPIIYEVERPVYYNPIVYREPGWWAGFSTPIWGGMTGYKKPWHGLPGMHPPPPPGPPPPGPPPPPPPPPSPPPPPPSPSPPPPSPHPPAPSP
jgi:hypothetical protein